MTKSGRPCVSWNARMSRLDPSIDVAENYCRNPDGDIGGPWCYVEGGRDDFDQREAWESCDIRWCENNGESENYRF